MLLAEHPEMIAEKVAGFMPPPVPRLTDDDSEWKWNEMMAELGIEQARPLAPFIT